MREFACFEDDETVTNGIGIEDSSRNFVKTMEDVRVRIINYGFEVERFYVSEHGYGKQIKLKSRNGTEFPKEVKMSMIRPADLMKNLIPAIEKGRLIIAFRGHGGPDRWGSPGDDTRGLLEVSDLKNLKIAGDFPTILFIIACDTGRFDLPETEESLAEAILKKKKVVPSLIASTSVSDTWLNDALMKAIFDGMWPGVLATFPGTTASYPVKYSRLGDILNYAKAYLPIRGTRSAEAIRDHLEIYHVIGDPTLELWTSEPKKLRIRAELIKTYLYITLSDSPNGGVLTIWYGDKMLKRIEPSSMRLVLSLSDIGLFSLPSREYSLSVCFWAPGYRFASVKA